MKIYIIGISGCGKSTLAKQLAHKLHCSHIELDHYRFLPGWIKQSDSKFVETVKGKTQVTNWIVCGTVEPPLKLI